MAPRTLILLLTRYARVAPLLWPTRMSCGEMNAAIVSAIRASNHGIKPRSNAGRKPYVGMTIQKPADRKDGANKRMLEVRCLIR